MQPRWQRLNSATRNCTIAQLTVSIQMTMLMRRRVWPSAIRRFLGLLLLAGGTGVWAQSPSVQALLRSGQAALDNDDYSRAAASFERAHQIAPDNLQASRGLVLSYLQLGRLADAVSIGEKLRTGGRMMPNFSTGSGLPTSKPGKFPTPAKHCKDLKRWMAHNTTSISMWRWFCSSRINPPRPPEELETAIKLQPSHALAHVLLGRAYQNTNRTLQAVEQFQSALRIDPNTPLGHYHLAFAYASLGRNHEAIAEYRKESARSPDNPKVIYQLGHCLLETGKLEDAITQLKKADRA